MDEEKIRNHIQFLWEQKERYAKNLYSQIESKPSGSWQNDLIESESFEDEIDCILKQKRRLSWIEELYKNLENKWFNTSKEMHLYIHRELSKAAPDINWKKDWHDWLKNNELHEGNENSYNTNDPQYEDKQDELVENFRRKIRPYLKDLYHNKNLSFKKELKYYSADNTNKALQNSIFIYQNLINSIESEIINSESRIGVE